jgi:hypothetical protein
MVQEKNIVRLGLTIIMFIALLGLVNTPALAHRKHVKRACSQTASSAFLACQYEVKDDYWIARGNCYNAKEDQAECFGDAKAEYKEAKEECRDQLEARKEVCEELGEAPYDPQLGNPAVNFVDPEEIGGDVDPNPYFPLVPGYQWVYTGGGETIIVTVTEDTKDIEYSGFTYKCAVVRDVVYEGDPADEDNIIEDTFDWYAQDILGNVWYLGESSRELEEGELVSIDGSWKAGAEDAKPGIIMYASPDPDNENQQNPYRQEFFLGDAEDVGEVKELGGPVNVLGTDYLSHVVIEDTTPLEPDASEDKYFAEGLGLYLEVPNEGYPVELVRFATTPTPYP